MLEVFLAQAAAVVSQPETTEVQRERLPHAVERMLSAALRLDDETELAAVVRAAKSAYPEHAAEIDALVTTLQTPVEPLRIDPLVVPAPVPVEYDRPGYWEDFHAELTLNAAETSGNSDTLYLGLHGKLNLMRKAQIHRIESYANTAEANGIESQNNWGLSYQLDTLWTDTYFGYVRGSLDRDDFSGFETQAFTGVGAGAYLMDTDRITLRSELGPGYRYLDLANEDKTIGAIGLYGAAELDWDIDENWTFEVDTKVNISGPTSSLHPTMKLNTVVSKRISAGVSYDLRYESNPPLMTEKLDRILRFDVKYTY
ncbi:DUF481 domain-containing protein [Henriciella aquimarina]|uniref:DUF481 domain-containing protein n=1 Tax=Henriciella aquimarina TaxID=545261 RepID=UPI000A007A61|nr:DUF481 domain-containing protein [Henriciella aquimarina]